ncbi:MAG: adenylosuccinate lyase [Calditrichales bacterium]|nr:MAG: adenylosuccinate lyase [Calditrichales bacterium]
MIERYSLPEIADIWSDSNRFSIWLRIEILATEALTKKGIVPEAALKNIKEKADFDVTRILEIEEEVKHDVIAFLTNVAEYVGDDARHIHYGMTSSDVLDTALAVQMVQAGEKIKTAMKELVAVLKQRALETKDMVMVGRSHGVHAEPVTFGLKLALWYDEMQRQIERLTQAIDHVRVGQISGAVGTFDHLDPDVQDYVCDKLGLKSANISSQILQRDRHAHFMNTIALVGGTLEKIAIEVRHLQRTEVLEASEYFSKGQKGSSAMPHKKNPIISERVSGMARLLRGNALAAMENMALWHERDISHSSVERVIIPDSTITLFYMLKKTTDLIKNLDLYPENMEKNLNLTHGLIFSQAVLLALTKKGISREDGYRIVQRNAMKVWDERVSFKDALMSDVQINQSFSADEIENIFCLQNRLKNVDEIYKRVGLL